MKSNARHQSGMFRLDYGIFILMGLLLGCVCAASPAEAVLTAQSFSGTVEVLLSGDPNWKPLAASMKLKAGDQIRTGPNSSVDLGFEDGSVVNLTEQTELAISQLDVSTENKTRVARFKLGWGTVTAKLTKLAYTESTCDVETDTVVAGVKFSEMTVSSPQNTDQVEVLAREGQAEIRRLSDQRKVKVSGVLDEKQGIAFALPSGAGAKVLVGVFKIVSKITLESTVPLRDIRVLLDSMTSLMKIDNGGKTPLKFNLKGIAGILGPQSSVTTGFPAGLELLIETVGGNLSFSVKQRGAVQCNGPYFFLNGGRFTVNGQALEVGVPNCFSPEGGPQPRKSRALNQPQPGTKEEQPVAPNPPQPQTSGSSGVELAPTVTPTPTLRPTATPIPVVEETPAATPTPIPELTPTPTPVSGTPLPVPVPAPTQTPASPSKIVPN